MSNVHDRPSQTGAIDVPLLRKALEHITSHPEEWDQEQWATKTMCGTAFCLAGHVAVMAGHKLAWERCCSDDFTASFTTDGEAIYDVARRLLGLGLGQAQDLFSGANDLERLWELAFRYTDGEIRTPPELEGLDDVDCE